MMLSSLIDNFLIPNLKCFFGYPAHPRSGIGYLASSFEQHRITHSVLGYGGCL